MTNEISNVDTDILACAERLGLVVKFEFVPFSKSRNAKEKMPSLNWCVTLQCGRDVLVTDYMSGCGHCPSYKQGARWTIDYDKLIRSECETGRASGIGRHRIEPKIADVLASLVSDASAIDYASYEDFAAEFGYDSDSRKGEKIYRQCLETGLKLRAALGENGLQELREACQEW